MAEKFVTLKIRAERLGTVAEVKEFLTDLEGAYNNIYVFDFLVDSLISDQTRRLDLFEQRLTRIEKSWSNTDYPDNSFYLGLLWREYGYGIHSSPPNLMDLQSSIDFEKIIIPGDKLMLTRVNVQSPGFWEFLGTLNPLQQIREYLKDRHERQKDKDYRSSQEERLGELTIIEKQNAIVGQRIEMLKSLGYSEAEIRQMVATMVTTPLGKLNRHQDNGQIDGVDE